MVISYYLFFLKLVAGISGLFVFLWEWQQVGFWNAFGLFELFEGHFLLVSKIFQALTRFTESCMYSLDLQNIACKHWIYNVSFLIDVLPIIHVLPKCSIGYFFGVIMTFICYVSGFMNEVEHFQEMKCELFRLDPVDYFSLVMQWENLKYGNWLPRHLERLRWPISSCCNQRPQSSNAIVKLLL